MPSNYTLLSHEVNLYHSQIKLYRVEGNSKFFEESSLDNHLDARYSEGIAYIDHNQTISTLYHLFGDFYQWLQHNDSISSLRTAYSSPDIIPSEYLSKWNIHPNDGLIYFLDYGSLLGSYRNQSIIPWDVNGDIGFMIKDMIQLPLEYETETWIFRQNPMYQQEEANELHLYDSHNTIAARVISKLNGVFINIVPYSLVDGTDITSEPYVYSTMDFLNSDKWHKASDLFPLNRTGGTLGELKHLGVPHFQENWLRTYYDDLSVPFKYRDGFDLDEDSNYVDYDSYGGWGYDDPRGEQLNDLQQEIERQKEEIQKLKELVLAKSND